MTDYYKAIKDILGATGVIIPIADGHSGIEAADHTSVTTQGGGGAHVWTYQPGTRNAYSLPATPLLGRGRIPILSLNGINEFLSTPDIDFYSRGDSLLDYPVSMGAWIRLKDATSSTILSKVGAALEWALLVDSGDRVSFTCRDVSAAVTIERRSNSALTNYQDTLVFLTATYDGSGGAAAMNGAIIYLNGVVMASAASNNASYVAMENGTGLPAVGSYGTVGSSLFDGSMLGKSLGPFFTQIGLTADQIRSLYQIGREAQKNPDMDMRRLGRR